MCCGAAEGHRKHLNFSTNPHNPSLGPSHSLHLPRSAQTIVAELALLRLKRISPANKCVYIAPLKSLARERLKEWRKNLGSKLNWQILELSGDTSHDARTMSKADVLVCTPEKWDLISRGWRDSGRDFVKQCKLLIIDEIHLLGEERGAVLEAIGEYFFDKKQEKRKHSHYILLVAVSRTRYISEYLKAQCEPPSSFTPTRILGLSSKSYGEIDMNYPGFLAVK